jgi:hypothetical protein
MRKAAFILSFSVILSIILVPGCTEKTGPLLMSITKFTAEPTIIEHGQTTNLSWQTFGAARVTIDHSIGNVSTYGSRIIEPNNTTIYTLTASNITHTLTATVQIIVHSNSQTGILINSFAVNPRIIHQGQTANLTWNITGASNVRIDHGIGNVSLAGARIINPLETTTYTSLAQM